MLAITQDTFLIFAANAFALLGLRALYFLLDGMAQRFEYLHYGLGALLVFVGAKMLAEDIIGHLPVGVSLGVIVAVLGASVGASLLFRPSAKRQRPPSGGGHCCGGPSAARASMRLVSMVATATARIAVGMSSVSETR